MDSDPGSGATAGTDGSASRYASIIEALRDGVFVVDMEGTITSVNDSLCSLLGRDRDELLGTTFRTATESVLVRPEEYERFVSMIDALEAGDSRERTESFEIAGQTERIVDVHLSKHSRENDTDEIIGIVRDVTERERRVQAAEQKQAALTELYEIGSDRSLSFEEKAERVLAVGCEFLELPYGFLTRIEDGVQRMVHTVGDHELLQPENSAPLEHSYCRKTVESEGLVGMEDARTQLGAADPAYETFELGCYIGTKIVVGENLYGTFCFAGPTGRDQQFTSGQREVVKLLGQWSGYELERQRFEQRLRGLHEVSQRLLLAETTEEVAETTVEVAADLFGLPLTAYWEYDSGEDVLRPLVETDEAREIVGDAPAFERGDGLVWESFESGEVRSYDDVTEESGRYNPQTALQAEVHVPCGNHGVVTSAATEPRAFDEVDIESLRLLGALVSEAMIAVERQQKLIERGEALQQQNDRLEEFADLVAHDLRNPLAGATGSLEIARETGDAEFFDTVERSLDRMDDLIGELLAIARGDNQATTVRDVSLQAAVEEAWSYTETPEATLSIEGHLGQIRADETRLLQLLGNLFRNCVEHCPDDVTVEVGPLTDDEGFSVADDGPGLSEDSLAAVRQMEKGDRTAAVGIGLMSVTDVVAEHGWDLSVANTDPGLRFEIRTGA